MDEVGKISANVDDGKTVTWTDAINKVVHAPPSATAHGRPLEIYGADAIRA
jgi:hypothetical protein